MTETQTYVERCGAIHHEMQGTATRIALPLQTVQNVEKRCGVRRGNVLTGMLKRLLLISNAKVWFVAV